MFKTPEENISKELPINILNTLKIAADSLGIVVKLEGNGIYYSQDNSRATAIGPDSIKFNSFNLKNMSQNESERVVYHECQHLRNRQIVFKMQQDNIPASAFILNETLRSLHNRMVRYYQEKYAQGYPFGKDINEEFATEISKMPRNGYFDPDELLALIRGYSIYKSQKVSNDKITTYPYEFIEVFQDFENSPDGFNLAQLLDDDYLMQLALETKQMIIEDDEVIEITFDDL